MFDTWPPDLQVKAASYAVFALVFFLLLGRTIYDEIYWWRRHKEKERLIALAKELCAQNDRESKRQGMLIMERAFQDDLEYLQYLIAMRKSVEAEWAKDPQEPYKH